MKMRLLFIFYLISFYSFCQKAKDIKFEEVKEIGINAYMNVKEPLKSIRMESGLIMEIEPIDASTLNDNFYDNSKFTGKYNYTFYTSKVENYFLDLKKRKSRYLKSEDEFLYEGLYYLLDNDEINELIYEQLVYEVSLGTKEASEQALAGIFTSHNKRNFNPFYLNTNDQYMNAFRISIRNSGSTPIDNKLKFNVFNSGDNLLALSDSDILSYYTYKGNIKMQNLLRANIDNHEIFPGNSTTEGYFVTLPLSLSENEISVAISDESSTAIITWEADVKRDIINNVQKFYELRLKPSSSTFRSYYVIDTEDSDAHIYVVGNYLYIHEADIDKNFVIYYYGMKTRKLFHGKTESIRMTDLLDFLKMKREKLKISTNHLSEVKRSDKSDK